MSIKILIISILLFSVNSYSHNNSNTECYKEVFKIKNIYHKRLVLDNYSMIDEYQHDYHDFHCSHPSHYHYNTQPYKSERIKTTLKEPKLVKIYCYHKLDYFFVLKLQKMLNQYNHHLIKEDGVYGLETQDSLKRYQKKFNLEEVDLSIESLSHIGLI